MKNTMKLMLVALMAFFMVACGNRIKEEDLKKAEASLFQNDQERCVAIFVNSSINHVDFLRIVREVDDRWLGLWALAIDMFEGDHTALGWFLNDLSESGDA